ncbi:RimK/LysX family protein [Shewanella aestuarii]|uniref:Retropepsin-like aspartic endopeptidase domain-containing protein n=1 Tax=Shewanella aestuarii TaxID=1028752 RepID=A0A6G9QJN6_9GAMM|nr:RimK/LysX family protein [Shewanella aestuarii]QIR14353.1 hypothetical protein HBH39_07520 [Shewanella aestuarii]
MIKNIIISVVLCLSLSSVFAAEKQILKQVETMTVAKSGLIYEARMDTGAANSSLHAIDLKVIGGADKKMKNNIGKMIEFTTENEKGEKKRIQAEIVDTSTVKNSQGTETRYIVKLDIGFADDLKRVHVNLRDRSHMDYKLLIGRNFLKKGYIVDVAEKKTIGPLAKLNVKQANLMFYTRIDTGAVENSLHAVNIRIENEDKNNMENNIGKMMTFTTENEHGKKVDVRTKIRGTSLIRNAQGSEIRYMVRLSIGEPGQEFLVDVNLKDRTKMTHKLLIGRNWLQGHYLVDVSKK